MSTIKNIIFDIGFVLVDFDFQGFLAQRFSPDICKRITDSVWGSELWCQLDLGIRPEEAIIDDFCANDPDISNEIRQTFAEFHSCMIRTDYATLWINELKNKGYNVYYLSNWSEYLLKGDKSVMDFLDIVDGGIFSYKVNLIKPHQEIYKCICDTYNLLPEECVFIDDRQENIDAAILFGMKGIRFSDYKETKAMLDKELDNITSWDTSCDNFNEYEEYVTFEITTKDGRTVEMAVVDEFEYERKNYLVSALIEDDHIASEDRFIYRTKLTADGGFIPEKITNPKEYEHIAKIYMELE